MLKKKYVKSKDEVEVTFQLPSDANEAAVVCEVNGWQPVAMKKSKGAFAAKLRLPVNGSYQYRFLVNNSEWLNDEAADRYVTNEHGSENSVVDTYNAN